MKTKFNYLLMLFAVLAMSVSFTSCDKDDDDEITGLQDYYIELNITDKGKFTASEANQLKAELNEILADWEEVLMMVDKETAIYAYDRVVKMFADLDWEETGIKTLQFTLTLKTQEGKSLKTKTLTIKNGECSVK